MTEKSQEEDFLDLQQIKESMFLEDEDTTDESNQPHAKVENFTLFKYVKSLSLQTEGENLEEKILILFIDPNFVCKINVCAYLQVNFYFK